jgi:hypothetical protein
MSGGVGKPYWTKLRHNQNKTFKRKRRRKKIYIMSKDIIFFGVMSCGHNPRKAKRGGGLGLGSRGKERGIGEGTGTGRWYWGLCN